LCPGSYLKNQLAAIELSIELSAVERHTPIVKTLASHTLVWPDELATRTFAQRLAAMGTPGGALAHASICLDGDLGAGKTTLVRHLLQALGVRGRIKSPTYAVVEPYELPGLNIWHFDFYRFTDPHEWEEAGFRDIFASPGLKLCEWPGKVGDLLPQPDLDIAIAAPPEHDSNMRSVQLRAYTPTGVALLAGTDTGSSTP
jgi:tRNA threonylcarbamoyladenosine biosynthesis protein TsaE